MPKSTSIWAVAVVAVLLAILFPAAGRVAPDPANASATTNTTVTVIEPLANSLLGVLLLGAVALTMAAIVTEGGW